MEYRGAELQLLQRNGSCDLQEGLRLGWREVAGVWEYGIERADPADQVSSKLCI